MIFLNNLKIIGYMTLLMIMTIKKVRKIVFKNNLNNNKKIWQNG